MKRIALESKRRPSTGCNSIPFNPLLLSLSSAPVIAGTEGHGCFIADGWNITSAREQSTHAIPPPSGNAAPTDSLTRKVTSKEIFLDN
jgi:hypothetical protein